MIAPTPRTIALVVAGAPVALVAGLVMPQLWFLAPVWAALVLAAFAYDAVMMPAPRPDALSLVTPVAVGVGDPFTATLRVAAHRDGDAAIGVEEKIDAAGRLEQPLVPDATGAAAHFALTAQRRGPSGIGAAWVRIAGPFGLAVRTVRQAFDRTIAIVPSLRAVEEEGLTLFQRDAQVGQRLTARLGEGSEFESLVRFMPGLDRRAIDWKQSARHTDLLAKQFETERDNRIVLAIDCGRMMSDPMPDADGASLSRLDRAVSAALALGYVALRLEDRVSLFAFAGRPAVMSRDFSRSGDFAALRKAAAEIDYSDAESNYTLGLATLGARLKRRALIVLFTEFADAASAELMLQAAQRLVQRHLIMFVVLADTEVEAIAARVPESAEDVAAATIAADLDRDRRVVLARLRRMGALVVEAPASGLAGRVLHQYIRVKRRGLI